MIDEIIENKSIVDQNIQIKINLPTELPKVFVDSQHISQVLNNLISNAIEAMPEGGELSIVAESIEHGIIVHVKDTGTGISDKNKGKIFQPLFTTKGHKGIGLGLALSKQLVELNDGSITFDSVLNKGTVFTIIIPINVKETQRV